MEDIKVGEYVRTDRGDIFKLNGYFRGNGFYSMEDKNGIVYGNPNKVTKKHSFNIIDLIEVGDYVNGDKIVSVHPYSWNENLESITIIEGATKGEIVEEDIKDIVTHEQFDSMKYIVGGKEE